MILREHISLIDHNTFGIDANAQHFVEATSEEELIAALQSKTSRETLILGGGSNILITKELIDALVIKVNIKGIKIISKTNDTTIVEVNAGENWHEFVLWTLENNYGGLENLSLIPGNVGTAPIQNIGAYGVELKDVFISCTTIHRETHKKRVFSKEECAFGYRDSIFKNTARNTYVITAVRFKLTNTNHKIHTSYGAIGQFLEAKNIQNPTIQDVSNAVIAIRKSKLPDPNEIGNSGSFFKNPVISHKNFNLLREKYPEIPNYILNKNEVKIPAGWLIEQCGFKGKRYGDAGVHKNQALVLVNYGNAKGKEIWALAQKIKSAVKEKFDIDIHPEVNII